MPAEGVVDGAEEAAAQPGARLVEGERRVQRAQAVEEAPGDLTALVEGLADLPLEGFEEQRHHRHVGDALLLQRVGDQLRAEGPLVHHRRAAGEGPDEAAHEVDRVVGRQHREVAVAAPEGEDLGEAAVLFEVVVVGQDAALRVTPGPGGVDEGRLIGAAPRHEVRRGRVVRGVLPALGARQLGSLGGLGDEHEGRVQRRLEADAELAQLGVLGDDDLRPAVGQQRPLLLAGELVVDGHEDGAAEERRVGADEPLALVAHHDGDAIAGADARVLQAPREGLGDALELEIGEARGLALAVPLDEGDLALVHQERVPEQLAQALVGLRRDHVRRPMTSARPAKVLTPWTS